jgi:hypothetical protein
MIARSQEMIAMSGTLPGRHVPAHEEKWPTGLHPGPAPQWPGPPTDAPPTPTPGPAPGYRHSRGRIAAVITGVVLVLLGLVPLGFGGGLLAIHLTDRHDGYLTVANADYRSAGSALTSDPVTLWGNGHLWYQASLLGDVRIVATAPSPDTHLFIGIASADAAKTYLSGAHYSTLTHLSGGRDTVVDHPGTTPLAAPMSTPIWTAAITGTGTQTLIWPSRDGVWTLVVMNADGSTPVNAHIDVGVTAPSLAWISATLLGIGTLILAAGILLIVIPMNRAARDRNMATRRN